MERALGAAQRDVEEPLLLVERLGGLRVRDRHEAALEAGDEHGVELETLRAVEREELDGVVAGTSSPSSPRSAVCRNARKPSTEPACRPVRAGTAFGVEVLVAEAHERVDVLPPFLGHSFVVVR